MHNDHSSRQYDEQLDVIRATVLQMGGLVEAQFRDAMACFESSRPALANQVMSMDDEVNHLEVVVDEMCGHVIVRRQPAAIDLRTVMASVKVITDLERIGDEATKIARISKALHARGMIGELQHFATVHEIATQAAAILHHALDAFARRDAHLAARLIHQDRLVDHEYRMILRNVITFMMEDPRTISTALDTLWVAKAIERIGDHAKNIAEYVIYIVEAKDIRHTNYVATVLSTEPAPPATT